MKKVREVIELMDWALESGFTIEFNEITGTKMWYEEGTFYTSEQLIEIYNER